VFDKDYKKTMLILIFNLYIPIKQLYFELSLLNTALIATDRSGESFEDLHAELI
jgi:hypothetical protein